MLCRQQVMVGPRSWQRRWRHGGAPGGAGQQAQSCTLSAAEWAGFKRAYVTLREQLTFFGRFAAVRCFNTWRDNCHAQRRRRRCADLQRSLLSCGPAFQATLAEADLLFSRLRNARSAAVQAGKLYSVAGWVEQQGNWRARRVQPEVEAAVAALVQLADAACARVQAHAEHQLAVVNPRELTDRIGVRPCG